jgi:hypothetical protein
VRDDLALSVSSLVKRKTGRIPMVVPELGPAAVFGAINKLNDH